MMTQSYGWNLQRLQHSRNNSNTNHGTDRDDKVSVTMWLESRATAALAK